jgi:hypothetical protein
VGNVTNNFESSKNSNISSKTLSNYTKNIPSQPNKKHDNLQATILASLPPPLETFESNVRTNPMKLPPQTQCV